MGTRIVISKTFIINIKIIQITWLLCLCWEHDPSCYTILCVTDLQNLNNDFTFIFACKKHLVREWMSEWVSWVEWVSEWVSECVSECVNWVELSVRISTVHYIEYWALVSEWVSEWVIWCQSFERYLGSRFCWRSALPRVRVCPVQSQQTSRSDVHLMLQRLSLVAVAWQSRRWCEEWSRSCSTRIPVGCQRAHKTLECMHIRYSWIVFC